MREGGARKRCPAKLRRQEESRDSGRGAEVSCRHRSYSDNDDTCSDHCRRRLAAADESFSVPRCARSIQSPSKSSRKLNPDSEPNGRQILGAWDFGGKRVPQTCLSVMLFVSAWPGTTARREPAAQRRKKGEQASEGSEGKIPPSLASFTSFFSAVFVWSLCVPFSAAKNPRDTSPQGDSRKEPYL